MKRARVARLRQQQRLRPDYCAGRRLVVHLSRALDEHRSEPPAKSSRVFLRSSLLAALAKSSLEYPAARRALTLPGMYVPVCKHTRPGEENLRKTRTRTLVQIGPKKCDCRARPAR